MANGKPAPAPAARERARLLRKRELAEQQVQRFEDEQSAHELDLARLDGVPPADRDESWEAARAGAVKAIDTISSAITVTLGEKGKLDSDSAAVEATR